VAVHIYTQRIHRTKQITTNVEECGACPVFASFTLAFVEKARKNLSQGKKNLSGEEKPQSEYSIHVNKKFQLDATVCRHLFTAKSLYMFRVSQYPSSGALKTVTATSGIGHNTGTATSFQRGLIRTTLKGSSCTSIMTYTRGSGYSF